jgi:hypothetical protein
MLTVIGNKRNIKCEQSLTLLLFLLLLLWKPTDNNEVNALEMSLTLYILPTLYKLC